MVDKAGEIVEMKNGVRYAVFHFYDEDSAASPHYFADCRKSMFSPIIECTMRPVCYFRRKS